ncbi:MAG: SIMPL domain-containing protein [Candidatus Pacebacteria bacterium]|nr:SIMPL domain-containing protein [Candidatus Paceibacterota bacterium]
MKITEKPFVIPATLIAIAIIIGLGLVAWGISARGGSNTISITGSASQSVRADNATWAVDLRRTAYESDIANATEAISTDAAAVEHYLSGQNLASSTVSVSVISTNQDYSSDKGSGAPTSYDVTESVTMTTNDVDKIDTLSHNIGGLNDLVSGGTIVSPEAPQYYVSSLPALRVSLLGAAIKDAKARASAIAQSGGTSVGALESASSGVVQVLSPNSTNVEDYGEYDTSTIEKDVMVTAHATFYVK